MRNQAACICCGMKPSQFDSSYVFVSLGAVGLICETCVDDTQQRIEKFKREQAARLAR